MRMVSFVVLVCTILTADFPARASGPLPEGQFITVKDGHLWYNGGRLRLWGVNFCSTVKRQGADLDLCFDRLADEGFNGVRVNFFDGNFVGGKGSPNTYTLPPSKKGDNSQLDLLDRSIYLAKQRGMFFWLQFCRGRTPPCEADYNVMPAPSAQAAAAGLDGPREEWAQLLKENGFLAHLMCIDERAERVYQAFAKALLEHVNPYTGRRWADEEAIGLWEMINEGEFVEWAISVQPTGIVKKRLTARWNAWLKERYKTDAALAGAWGKLNPGESLASGTVWYGPTTGGVEVSGAGVQKEYVAKDPKLGNYPYARAEDLVRFAIGLYTGHTQRFIAFVRTLAPKGVGINVVPITPTGRFGASLQSYCAASCGDFCATGCYGFAMRPWEVKPDHPYYPFVVRVNEHPLMEQPIDLVRVKDKPYLIYEINDTRPNPYMVEFHTRALAFAAWQDYDGVFWFNWDDAYYLSTLKTDKDYVSQRMPIPDSSYPNAGLILANDEAALASLKAMGTAFKTGAIPPADKPVEVTIGRDILLNLRHPGLGCLENLPELSTLLRPVIWRHGLRTIFDMQSPSKLPVPITDPATRLNMGQSTIFDWSNQRGYIRIDTPSAKIYTGFLPPFLNFEGGLSIKHIDRQWGTIAVVAEDGKPLAESSSVLVVAVSRNMNTGMEVTPERLATTDLWQQGEAQMCGVPGKAPPVVDRIGCVIRAPWLKGVDFGKYDFTRTCFTKGTLDGKLELRDYEPLFYARLTRSGPPIIRKIVVAGNSLAWHPPLANSDWNNSWGMAASSQDKDYAHLIYQLIAKTQKEKPELIVENFYDPTITEPAKHEKLASLKADLYIIQIGDNLKDPESNEKTLGLPYEQMLKTIKRANPNALIFCASTWGGSQNKDRLMRAACERQNVPFVRIDTFIGDEKNRAISEGHFKHGGVNWHPGDRGMQKIADALWQTIQPVLVSPTKGK